MKSKIFYIHAKDHTPLSFDALKTALCITGFQGKNFAPFDFGNITLNLIGPPGGETSFAIVLWVAEDCPQTVYDKHFSAAQDLHNKLLSVVQSEQAPAPTSLSWLN
jgi:hypothetical protein